MILAASVPGQQIKNLTDPILLDFYYSQKVSWQTSMSIIWISVTATPRNTLEILNSKIQFGFASIIIAKRQFVILQHPILLNMVRNQVASRYWF